VGVLTSSANPAEMQRAKELGVREFVRKPMDFEDFSKGDPENDPGLAVLGGLSPHFIATLLDILIEHH